MNFDSECAVGHYTVPCVGYSHSKQNLPCCIHSKLFNPYHIGHWKKLNFGRLAPLEFEVLQWNPLISQWAYCISKHDELNLKIAIIASVPSSPDSVSVHFMRSGCLFSVTPYGSVTKSNATSCHTWYYAVKHTSSARHYSAPMWGKESKIKFLKKSFICDVVATLKCGTGLGPHGKAEQMRTRRGWERRWEGVGLSSWRGMHALRNTSSVLL